MSFLNGLVNSLDFYGKSLQEKLAGIEDGRTEYDLNTFIENAKHIYNQIPFKPIEAPLKDFDLISVSYRTGDGLGYGEVIPLLWRKIHLPFSLDFEKVYSIKAYNLDGSLNMTSPYIGRIKGTDLLDVYCFVNRVNCCTDLDFLAFFASYNLTLE